MNGDMLSGSTPQEQLQPANNPTKRRRILVTGGSGFLGAVLAENLALQHEVAFTYCNNKVQLSRCKGMHMDITRPETIAPVLRSFNPEVVIHAAAEPRGSICQKNPELAQRVNLFGTERLMDALPRPDMPFIFLSTDLIFDGEKAPYHEESIPEPISLYGISKMSAEQSVLQRGVSSIVLRAALIYGHMPGSGKGSFLQWMNNALSNRTPIKLFHDEYRTPVYALDIVRVVRALLEQHPPYQVFHIGGPERLNRVEFAEKLAAVHGYDPGLIMPVSLADLDTGYPRPRDVSLDTTRVQESLGIQLTPVEEALWEIYGGF